jgi:hypothetical protein
LGEALEILKLNPVTPSFIGSTSEFRRKRDTSCAASWHDKVHDKDRNSSKMTKK